MLYPHVDRPMRDKQTKQLTGGVIGCICGALASLHRTSYCFMTSFMRLPFCWISSGARLQRLLHCRNTTFYIVFHPSAKLRALQQLTSHFRGWFALWGSPMLHCLVSIRFFGAFPHGMVVNCTDPVTFYFYVFSCFFTMRATQIRTVAKNTRFGADVSWAILSKNPTVSIRLCNKFQSNRNFK